MKKSAKSKSGSAAPQVDPYLEGLMGKLLERLTALEKKMDAVLSHVASKPGTPSADHPKPAQAPASAAQPPRRERQLYEAICADCHQVCEVPFRPSESRPVYCKPCFAKRKGRSLEMNMPVFTPVALPSKPAGKMNAPQSQAVLEPPAASKKAAKKQKPAKGKKKR